MSAKKTYESEHNRFREQRKKPIITRCVGKGRVRRSLPHRVSIVGRSISGTHETERRGPDVILPRFDSPHV